METSKGKKVLQINLGLFVLYSILCVAGSIDFLGGMFTSCIIMIPHAIIAIFISVVYFINKNNELGRAWLLSAGLMTLIGFSTCFGALAVN